MTTALATPPFVVCLQGTFDGSDLLMQFQDTQWVALPPEPASSTPALCGDAQWLSAFAVLAPIAQTPQTITFGPLANKTFGDPPFAVSATASSGLPVSFSIVSGPATIAGSVVTLTGIGVVTVRASQAGNSNYSPAADVDQSFMVRRSRLPHWSTGPGNNDNRHGNGSTIVGQTSVRASAFDKPRVDRPELHAGAELIGVDREAPFDARSVPPGMGVRLAARATDPARNSASDSVDVIVGLAAVDRQPPSAPADLRATLSREKVVLTWSAATDNVGVASYRIYQAIQRRAGGVEWRLVKDRVAGLSATLEDLEDGSNTFAVSAVDTWGNESPRSTLASL